MASSKRQMFYNPSSGRHVIKSYLQDLEVDGKTDLVEWWRLHHGKLYLCIPAPAEIPFSTGGKLVTCHRRADLFSCLITCRSCERTLGWPGKRVTVFVLCTKRVALLCFALALFCLGGRGVVHYEAYSFNTANERQLCIL